MRATGETPVAGGHTFRFPDGFLWGAATAAHQVEGANLHNNWTEWAEQYAGVLALTAHVRDYGTGTLPGDIWQRMGSELEERSNYLLDNRVDHYHRYEEDLDILESLGANSYRFSIEWSRNEPGYQDYDPDKFEHYRRMIRAVQARGMRPVITLHHFTEPTWFTRGGSWTNPDSPRVFGEYTRMLTAVLEDELGDSIIGTFNEPNVLVANGYLTGAWAPSRFDEQRRVAGVAAYWNLAEAHKRVYEIVKRRLPMTPVAAVMNVTDFEMEEPHAKPSIKKRLADFVMNQGLFFALTKDMHDFAGVNTYFRDGSASEPRSDLGWPTDPGSLGSVAAHVWKQTGLPVMIMEHGVADARDEVRGEFIKKSLGGLALAMQDGAEVLGYHHWSLLDNYEWAAGYAGKFGLIAVDPATGERTVRPSAYTYGDIMKTNQIHLPA